MAILALKFSLRPANIVIYRKLGLVEITPPKHIAYVDPLPAHFSDLPALLGEQLLDELLTHLIKVKVIEFGIVAVFITVQLDDIIAFVFDE